MWSHPIAYSVCMLHKHSSIMCYSLCTLEETPTNCEHSWKFSSILGMSKYFVRTITDDWLVGRSVFFLRWFWEVSLEYSGACLEWLCKTCPSRTHVTDHSWQRIVELYIDCQWGLRVEWLRFSYHFVWAWIFKTLRVLKDWIQIDSREVSSARHRQEGWSSKKSSVPHPHSIYIIIMQLNVKLTLHISMLCLALKKSVLYRLGIALLFLFCVSASRSLTSYSLHQQHKEFYIGCDMQFFVMYLTFIFWD